MLFRSEHVIRAAVRERQAVHEHERQRAGGNWDTVQAEMKTMVWSQPSIKHSFYKNADGVVNSLSPWRLVDYWTWTRTVDPADFLTR